MSTAHRDDEHPDRPPGLVPGALHSPAVHALGRSLLVTCGVVVAYFTLPIQGEMSGSALLVLVLGSAAVVALLVTQVRGISRSPYPVVRGVAVLTTTIPLFLVVFATVYYVIGLQEPASWSEALTRLDALYLCVTIFATVGFGDIHAVSQTTRALVMVQMVANLVLLGLVTRVVLRAVQLEVARRTGQPEGDGQ
jgi:voltage-gated potassium channel